jgi:NMT1/THI5 like
MRVATLAALAGLIGFAHPAFALDKVRFGTNWLADPEAGGFFQAVADGTYEKYGLDVTIIPGGPQSNGGLLLLFGKLDFFMGGDMIGNLIGAESKLPLIAVAADFQKSPQVLMSHPDAGLDKWAERLERRFRFPKLCTCAGMRRKYPGHGPYGLGALCQLYEIDLQNHHRALCDARAAAHLLNLINSKRIDEMREAAPGERAA